VSGQVADNAMMSLAPDLPSMRRVAFRAGKRDSVASVARRYRVSTSQVAQWNQVGAGASFKAGQMVIVYMASKAKPASVRTASAAPGHRTASTKTASSRNLRQVATRSSVRVSKSDKLSLRARPAE
jgi:membrane-bound lytic murein transglycosylase D